MCKPKKSLFVLRKESNEVGQPYSRNQSLRIVFFSLEKTTLTSGCGLNVGSLSMDSRRLGALCKDHLAMLSGKASLSMLDT